MANIDSVINSPLFVNMPQMIHVNSVKDLRLKKETHIPLNSIQQIKIKINFGLLKSVFFSKCFITSPNQWKKIKPYCFNMALKDFLFTCFIKI